MDENTDSDKVELQETEWAQAPAVPRIYANLVNLDWTLYDITMRFGQLKYVGDPRLRRLTAEEQASITVAWAEAKYLRDMLNEVLAKYERVNGEIDRPKLAK